ncbi:uncharacterized protein LOC113061227 [Carassius auratus]|uniref:Uncharacterized protein LOC113061227 n=1 Tax=Carassius auratus TaxID=7957 RepID=A0A6P6LRC6_CARAU|nr:uncharacterized protein LOC113061227 [Carassius auratus]
MEELLKHLTEVSIHQQQIMEHMASRQRETERDLAALRMAAGAHRGRPGGVAQGRVHRRRGITLGNLGGPPGAAVEGATGTALGWPDCQPPEVSPGPLGSKVSGVPGGSRPDQTSGEEGGSNPLHAAAPLQDTDLTRKGQPEKVPWTPETEAAFHRIKAALTTESVLRAPDFNCPFLAQTDTSDTGLGAVLSQVHDGEEHPVIYISRKLTPTVQRYAKVEREALAVKWGVLELRYYLLGRPFTLITDHAPLQWMAWAKEMNARVMWWFLALQDFNFTVQHRAGTADGLSRIWAAFASLSWSTPRPSPVSPLLNRTRTTLRGLGEHLVCGSPVGKNAMLMLEVI